MKSCNTMRATTNGDFAVRSSTGFQLASARTAAFAHAFAVAIAQDGFQHDADADGEFEIGPTPAFSSAGSE